MIKTIVVALVLCFMEIAVIVIASPLAKTSITELRKEILDDTLKKIEAEKQ